MIQLRTLTQFLALALPTLAVAGPRSSAPLEEVRALGEIQTLRVDVYDLDVLIQSSDGPGLVMALRGRGGLGDAMKAPKVFESNGRVIIYQEESSGRGRRRSQGTLELKVPGGAPLEVKSRQGSIMIEDVPVPVSATLSSTTGDITVGREAILGRVTMSTPSGQITFNGEASSIRANTTQGGIFLAPQTLPISCELNSASGSVQIIGGCASLEASTTSGSITGLGLKGSVDAQSIEGWISLTLESLGAGKRASLHTTSGPITLGLPAHSRPKGSLETLGTISCDGLPLVPNYGSPYRFNFPGEEGTLDISSTGGAIRVSQGAGLGSHLGNRLGNQLGTHPGSQNSSSGQRQGRGRSDEGSSSAP